MTNEQLDILAEKYLRMTKNHDVYYFDKKIQTFHDFVVVVMGYDPYN